MTQGSQSLALGLALAAASQLVNYCKLEACVSQQRPVHQIELLPTYLTRDDPDQHLL
jgi:hypothetical protein